VGLGGYLTWTPVAREIYSRLGGVKMLPYETHGHIMRIINSEIFYNNPYFVQKGEAIDNVFPLCLNNPETNYCKKDTAERAIQRHDKHISQQICEFYGISLKEFSCEIFLTDEEEEFGENFASGVKSEFITIDPHTKDEYTVNKRYPFKKWQSFVDSISKDMAVVQVGEKTDQALKGCINMSGETTFRQAGSIIKRSKAYIGSEGGLMHLARAVKTNSVIVITGFLHPTMTCYPENYNIWIGKNHGPCGMKISCETCKTEVEEHSYKEIAEALKRIEQ
jgi:ADP-heptose:LPS heptosyltransferase